MLRPFRLKGPIGLEYNMDMDDAFNTKKALRDLGHFHVPKFGLTPYPDEPMIEGIKSFQRQNGLREDGVMKPDGPTIKRLNDTLVERQRPKPPPGPFSTVPLPRPFPLPRRRNLLDAILDPQGRRDKTLSNIPIQSPLKDSVGKPFPPRPGADSSTGKPKTGTQVAMGPAAAVLPFLLSTAGRMALQRGLQSLLGGGATAAIGSLKGDTPDDQDVPSAKQMDPAPTVPPTPGSEPPKEKDRPPTKTESPAQPVELPDLSQPLPKVDKPTIFIHPALPEELRGGTIIERKGNEATRKELEGIRDFYESQGWKHVAGGRYSKRHENVLNGKQKAGDEQEERHIKGHFGSLKGGHFTDLTFETPDGRIVHVQTVDVDRNGKPTEREIDTAERIRRAVENEHILLIPKGAQLERNQRFRRGR